MGTFFLILIAAAIVGGIGYGIYRECQKQDKREADITAMGVLLDNRITEVTEKIGANLAQNKEHFKEAMLHIKEATKHLTVPLTTQSSNTWDFRQEWYQIGLDEVAQAERILEMYLKDWDARPRTL